VLSVFTAFSRSPGQAPKGARSACAKRAAYSDPPPRSPSSRIPRCPGCLYRGSIARVTIKRPISALVKANWPATLSLRASRGKSPSLTLTPATPVAPPSFPFDNKQHQARLGPWRRCRGAVEERAQSQRQEAETAEGRLLHCAVPVHAPVATYHQIASDEHRTVLFKLHFRDLTPAQVFGTGFRNNKRHDYECMAHQQSCHIFTLYLLITC